MTDNREGNGALLRWRRVFQNAASAKRVRISLAQARLCRHGGWQSLASFAMDGGAQA